MIQVQFNPAHKNFTYNATSGYSPFVKDMETGETRNSTAADLKDYAVLCDYLDLVAFFWPIAMPTEEKSPILEELCALDVSLRNTRKHIQCSCAWGTAAEYQIQLAAVVAGRRALRKTRFFCRSLPNTPLIFGKDVVEAMIILAEPGAGCAYERAFGGDHSTCYPGGSHYPHQCRTNCYPGYFKMRQP